VWRGHAAIYQKGVASAIGVVRATMSRRAPEQHERMKKRRIRIGRAV